MFSAMIDDLGRKKEKKEKKKRTLSISKKRLVHGDDDLLVDNSSLAFKREIPCSGYLQNSQPTMYLSKRLERSSHTLAYMYINCLHSFNACVFFLASWRCKLITHYPSASTILASDSVR